MDFWRYRSINGRLTQAPIPGLWAPGAGSARDPAVPWLPLGDLTPDAIPTPKPEIALRSSNSLAFGNRTNSTFTAPAGIVDGDIIVLLFEIGAAVANVGLLPTPTPPTGFAAFGSKLDLSDGAYSVSQYLYWKRASGESGNYTVTHTVSDSSGFIGAYSGALESGTPFGASSADNTGTGTLAIALSLDTTASRSRIIYHKADLTGGATVPPDGMIERLDASMYVADQRIATIETSATRRHDITSSAGWATRMVEMLAGTGSGTTTGVGAATATGAAAGVGRATTRRPGTASATGAAAATGRSTVRATGAASAPGAAAGVGRGLALAVGAAAGTGTASATGRSTARSPGSAAGIGAATATGRGTARSPGSAAGIGAATATGRSTARSAGAAAGVGAAAAVASGGSSGSATGGGTTIGVGRSTARAQALGAAIGAAAAVGRAAARATVMATALGAAVGIGRSTARSMGAAGGAGTAAAGGRSTARAVGVATATGGAMASSTDSGSGDGSRIIPSVFIPLGRIPRWIPNIFVPKR